MNTMKRAKELACRKNLTLFKLAQISGLAPSVFGNCERRGGQLSVDTIEKICYGLDISLADFFTEEAT